MNKDLTKIISKNLKKIRESKGMTQNEVAENSGTNVNYYAKLERGEAVPSLKMLQRVLNALGSKFSDILP